MWLLILLVAGIALAANKQKQAQAGAITAPSPAQTLAPVEWIRQFLYGDLPAKGINGVTGLPPGAPLSANQGQSFLGPSIYTSVKPVAAGGGASASGGGGSSGTGSGGTGFSVPGGFHGIFVQ